MMHAGRGAALVGIIMGASIVAISWTIAGEEAEPRLCTELRSFFVRQDPCGFRPCSEVEDFPHDVHEATSLSAEGQRWLLYALYCDQTPRSGPYSIAISIIPDQLGIALAPAFAEYAADRQQGFVPRGYAVDIVRKWGARAQAPLLIKLLDPEEDRMTVAHVLDALREFGAVREGVPRAALLAGVGETFHHQEYASCFLLDAIRNHGVDAELVAKLLMVSASRCNSSVRRRVLSESGADVELERAVAEMCEGVSPCCKTPLVN